MTDFDYSRETWFHSHCITEGCGAEITGRSLDGNPPYWWHAISATDSDHDANPGGNA